jgi:hypothetical protein
VDVPDPELRWTEEVELREPEWCGPNDSVIGGPVLAEPVLVRTGDVLVVVRDAVVYPFGMGFRIEVLLGAGRDGGHRTTGLHDWDDPLAPGGMLVEVMRADGVAVRHSGPPAATAAPPPEPVLVHRGAEGGRDAWAQDYWLWPAPPEGDLVVRVRWPDRGVAVAEGTVTAAQMEAARGRIIG